MLMIATSISKPGVGLPVGLTAGIFRDVSGYIDDVATGVAFNVGEGDILLVRPGDVGEAVGARVESGAVVGVESCIIVGLIVTKGDLNVKDIEHMAIS